MEKTEKMLLKALEHVSSCAYCKAGWKLALANASLKKIVETASPQNKNPWAWGKSLRDSAFYLERELCPQCFNAVKACLDSKISFFELMAVLSEFREHRAAIKC